MSPLRAIADRSATARQLRYALLLLLSVFVLGAIGFHIIGNHSWFDAFELTVVTLTTIGNRSFKEMGMPERVFAIALIVLGLTMVYVSFALITRYIVESEISGYMGIRRMERKIMKLKQHVIICGFGRMGRVIASDLRTAGLKFVIIDNDDESVIKAEEEGFTALRGDATQDEMLKKAGVEQAKTLICVTASDADNLFITMSGRQLNPALKVISRASGEAVSDKLRRAGANKVISPYHIGGRTIAQAAIKPNVIEFIELATSRADLEFIMEEIRVGQESPVSEKTLRELNLGGKFRVIVIGIRRAGGELVFSPPADTLLRAGDILIALGSESALQQLEKLVGA